MKYSILQKYQSKKVESNNFFHKGLNVDFKDISGYYLSNSLHFYGYEVSNDFDNILFMNNVLRKLYAFVDLKDTFAFGEYLFGNQFVFEDGNINLFFIESANKEHITNGTFADFLDKVLGNADYFSGYSLVENFDDTHIEILYKGNRMSPLKPFVLGGDFTLENLFINKYADNLELNCNLAKQIYNLPDGQPIEINLL